MILTARSMKAGAFTPATLLFVVRFERVQPERSMKAGAFTPATPVAMSVTRAPCCAQ